MAEEEGRISWSAELSDKGFQEGARRMQQEINRITVAVDESGKSVDRFSNEMDGLADSTRKAKRETDDLSSSFGNLTKYAAGFFSLAAVKEFGQKIFAVRSEIQSLETSFETLVGNKPQAEELFNSIREFAVNTPMQMKDLASSAQTMMSFNIPVEQIMENLKALGDVSMGDAQKFQSLSLAFSQMSATGKLMGQDLLQMINAGFNPLSTIAERTGKSISQLKDEMSKGAISADMVRQAFIDATSEGGKFYKMLESKSKTLEGAYSNLQGAIDDMFNEIGKNTQGIISGAIDAATTLVKNYEEVGKAILFIVATYGEYKAAVMVNIALEKAQAFNRLASAKGLTAMQLATSILTEKTKALNAVLMKNPYVLVATAVMSAVSAYVIFARSTDTAAKKAKALQEELKNQDRELGENRASLQRLQTEWKNLTSDKEKKQWIEDNKDEFHNLGIEIDTVQDAENAFVNNSGAIIKAMELRAKAAAYAAMATRSYQAALENREEAKARGGKSLKDAGRGVLRNGIYGLGDLYTSFRTAWNQSVADQEEQNAKEYLAEQKKLNDEAAKLLKDARVKAASSSSSGGKGGGKTKGGKGGSNDAADRAADRIRAELELEEAAMKARIETERALSEAYVAAIEDDSEREREARRIQHENTVRDIQAQEDDFYKSVYEARKKAYEAANKGKYENTAAGAAGWGASVMAGTLTESEQQQYVTATKKMHAQLEKENAEYFRSVASDIAQEERTNKEAISNYLKQYGDYAEKKQAIYSDANDKICEYEKQLSQATTEEGRAAAQARIDTVKEETKAQISELDVQYGKAKAFMVDLFEDTSSKSINAINEIIEKYETLLRFLKGDGSVTRGTLLDYGFSDSEIDKALQNMKTNGVSSIKDITDALKNLRREVGTRSVWQQLKQDIDDANAATDNGTKIQMMAQVALEAVPQFESLGNAIFSAFDIDDSQMKSATQALKDFASVAKGIGQFKSGDKIGGFMSIASAIVSAAGQIAGAIDEEKQKDRQRILSRIDHRLQITDERISELNETLRSSYGLEAQRVAEESRQQAKTKQQQALEGLMGVNVSGKGQLDISQLAKTLGEMYGLNYGPDRTGNVYGTMMGFMWNDLLRNNPAEDLINMFIEQRDMIASVLGDEWDKILEYIDAMKDAQDTINDTMMMEKEQIVGTTFGSVFDDMLNSLYDLGDGAEDVFSGISDSWQQMINRMVINNMLAEDMRKELQDWYDSWHDAWENDNDITSDELESLREGYNSIFSEYSGKIEQLRNMGIIKSIAKSEEEAMDELEEATMDYLDNMRSAFEDLVSDSETNMEEWSINLRNSILRNLIQSKLLDEEFDKWANDWAERYSNIISAYNGGNIQKSVYEGLMDDLMAEFNQRTGEIAEKSQQMWEAFGLSIPEQQAEEAAEEMKSAFSDLHQSFLSTLTDMNGDAEAWSKQITKTMVEQMVEKNILNDAFDGAMDDWKKRFENAVTAGDTEGLKALRKELEDLRGSLAEQAHAYMEALGYVEDVVDNVKKETEHAFSNLSDTLVSSVMDLDKSAEEVGRDIGKTLVEQMIKQMVESKYAKRIESIQKMWDGVLNGTSKNTINSVKREILRLYKAIGNETKELTDELREIIEEEMEDVNLFDNLHSSLLSFLTDAGQDIDSFINDLRKNITSQLIDEFVLEGLDEQMALWNAEMKKIMSLGGSPEQIAKDAKELTDQIAAYSESKKKEADMWNQMMGVDNSDYGDQKASVNMADKATYDQFETYLGIATATMIGQEQGNAVRLQILQTLQTMGGITSSSSSEEMRNMMMLANEYLLDIKRSNREILDQFSVKLDSINQKLSRL